MKSKLDNSISLTVLNNIDKLRNRLYISRRYQLSEELSNQLDIQLDDKLGTQLYDKLSEQLFKNLW